MRRLTSLALAIVLSLVLVGPAAAVGPGESGTHAPLYYLSLGDSLAAGYQPTGDPADMYRTDEGYADQLYAIARTWYPNLRLVKLGCPGETTATFVDGGICAYENGSQLDEALAFLHAHGRFVAFVTIDIGFNDFPCQTGLECFGPGVTSIQANLPGILATLKAAVEPGTPIVGGTIYDPFLAYWLAGPAGQALAQLSVFGGVVPLNAFLTGLYTQAGVEVADVQTPFATTDFTIDPDVGVPTNVARICAWTWKCSPFVDNHANEAGYGVIAGAFAQALAPLLQV